MLLLAACQPTPLTCRAEVSPTVATVLLVACEGAEGDVTVTYDDLVTPAFPAGEVIPLHGLPGRTTVHWVAEDSAGRTAEGNQATGEIPADLPSFELVTPYSGDGPRWFVGSVFGTVPARFILDRDGQYVWYQALTEDLWTIETMFSTTAYGLLSNEFAADRSVDLGNVRRIDLDGAVTSSYNPVDSHHHFTELGPEAGADAGTIAVLTMDVRSWTDPDSGETMDVVGDAVVEVTPQGDRRTVFSLWDWLPVTRTPEFDIPFYPSGKDWSHGNAISWIPEDDTYLVSFNNLALVVEFDRASGTPVAWYGEADTEPPALAFEEGSRKWHHQHNVRRDGDLLTAFITDEESSDSGGVTWQIVDGKLREVWSGGFDTELRSAFLGGMEPLANGNYLVNYGAARMLRELAPDGEELWRLDTETANFYGEVHPVDDIYTGR